MHLHYRWDVAQSLTALLNVLKKKVTLKSISLLCKGQAKEFVIFQFILNKYFLSR
jgi:hypothetical protein